MESSLCYSVAEKSEGTLNASHSFTDTEASQGKQSTFIGSRCQWSLAPNKVRQDVEALEEMPIYCELVETAPVSWR